MAHSLRSKSKLKSKHIKTINPNSDYFKATENRTQRLAQKTKENLEKQNMEKALISEENMEESSKSKVLEKPVEEILKVKTHGWRKSKSADYKKRKASKRNKSLKF